MSETRPPEAWNNVNSDVVNQFRSDNGKISSGMFKGARLLLLTTTGAKSRQGADQSAGVHARRRQLRDHRLERRLADASGLVPQHPGESTKSASKWPRESGVDQFAARARIAEGDERERLYGAQAAVMPNFAEYQKKTSREIPGSRPGAAPLGSPRPPPGPWREPDRQAWRRVDRLWPPTDRRPLPHPVGKPAGGARVRRRGTVTGRHDRGLQVGGAPVTLGRGHRKPQVPPIAER